ncbi:zinc finger protein 260-like [Nematolebias whitei]|uniref:zinc finger protein 260-like n=1 Tax=Nematolebias whitei TaxID=451745 RepID=UPI001896E926|nr:zinc finger protein 260-like [Nematolebias whitei]
MWRQQVQQHLDAEEEEMEVFLGSRDALEQETSGGSQILDAVFSPNDQLHIIVVPADVQKSVLIKEEAPEEQWPDVDKQDANCLHIKEEEEEQWTILGGGQLSMKEETDVTSFSLTAVPFKSEDDEEKPLFSQLHQHQDKVCDLPTSSSGDHEELSTGEGEKDSKKQDLNAYRDSDSSETEVSEDDEEDNDVNNPESQMKLLSDIGLKTEDTDDIWESSPSRVSESSVNRVHNKNGLKPFGCDVCGRRFIHKVYLKRHMKIHTGQKPFSCDLCEKRFSVKGNLTRHMMIHTGQKPFSCDLCEKRFTEKGGLRRHMLIHTGQKPFSCHLCEKRFTVNGSLKKHMIVHTGQKPFSCDLCEKCFTEKGSLRRHMIIHTGQKPFFCDLCEKRFAEKASLKKHMKIHTGQKPFCCDLCGRRFKRRGCLNRHIRIHTRQKPFSCDQCSQKFSKKDRLKKHMIIHTGQKPFSLVPADVQKSVLIKEEAPEEQWPDVDQQDANCLHIKEEEEEQWTILGGGQLSMKEETDVTSFSLTAVPFKSEDDEEKPLFSQLHQHQDEVCDLPTSSSGDHKESATGEGEKD